jgi:hypothetical protein
MWSIENNAGRLVEIKVASPVNMTEAAEFQAKLVQTVQLTPGRIVLCADIREATVFAPEVAARVTGMLRAENAKLERGAILLPPENAVFGIQIERLIREAGADYRQTFRETKPAIVWLSQSLHVREIARLRVFLSNAQEESAVRKAVETPVRKVVDEKAPRRTPSIPPRRSRTGRLAS